MFSLNRVQLLGNITFIQDLKKFDSGTSLLKFGIATNESWFDKKKDDYVDEVTFHNVVAWGKLAERIEKHETKGSKIFIEGKIKINEYTDKEGIKRKSFDIVAEKYLKLSGKKSQETTVSKSHESKEPTSQDDESDEIPF